MSRYQGGKNGAGVYQTIINAIPRHHFYVEAFAGSAAVFRHMRPATFGALLIESSAAQAERLRLELASPGRAGWLPSGRVEVAHADALQLLPAMLEDGRLDAQSFVYLDPPYHPSARRDLDLYECELIAEDHEQLLHSILPAMTAARVRWALSGYRCAAYDDAAAEYGWHRLDYTAQTRRGPVIESLWTPYDPREIRHLQDYRYLGADFRERERIARKVRRWSTKLARLDRHEQQAILEALANIARGGEEIASPELAMEPGAGQNECHEAPQLHPDARSTASDHGRHQHADGRNAPRDGADGRSAKSDLVRADLRREQGPARPLHGCGAVRVHEGRGADVAHADALRGGCRPARPAVSRPGGAAEPVRRLTGGRL